MALTTQPQKSRAQGDVHRVQFLAGSPADLSAIALSQVLQQCDAESGAAAFVRVSGEFVAMWTAPDGSSFELYRSPACPDGAYLSRASDGTITASALPPSTADSAVRRDRLGAIIMQMRLGGGDTLQHDVTRLPAGYAATISNGTIGKVRQLSRLKVRPPRGIRSPHLLAQELRELVRASVRRAAAGRSVAVAVSGGLDSSVIAFEAKRVAADLCLVHFTWGDNSERRAVQALAAHLGAPIAYLDLHDLDSVTAAPVDPPYTYQKASWYHALFQSVASSGATVVLFGDVADEAFQGDPLLPGGIFWEVANPVFENRWPRVFRRKALNQVYGRDTRSERWDGADRYVPPDERRLRASLPDFLTHDAKHSLVDLAVESSEWYRGELLRDRGHMPIGPHTLGKWFSVATLLEEPQIDSLRVLASHYGVERRLPFADTDLVEFCWALPEQLRTARLGGTLYQKALLRAAYAAYLPETIVRRTSQPPINAVELSRYSLHGLDGMRAVLQPEGPLVAAGIVDASKTRALCAQPEEGMQLSYRYVTSCLRLAEWLGNYGNVR